MEKKKREELFWSKVAVKSSEECWNWTACLDRCGYGQFNNGIIMCKAHRFAWELHYNQKVPTGMCILHHCDNPACVNHHHLYCGTQKDNAQDRVTRGRTNITYSCLEVSPEKIQLIKKLHKVDKLSYRKISKIVGVGPTTAYKYANNG